MRFRELVIDAKKSLETKEEHLKGNDDTEYNRKLFEVLTTHAATAIRAGELLH